MFNLIGYDVFRERSEKIFYVLASVSLAVYVWQYHLAKSLLFLCVLLALVLVIPRVKEYFSNLSKIDLAWIVVIVLYPCSYYMAYLIHGRGLDLYRGNDLAINSLVGLSLFLVIRRTDFFSIENFCRYIAPSIAIAGLILLWKWLFEGIPQRWTIGTNLVLVFACVASAVSMFCFWYALNGKEKLWVRFLFLFSGLFGLISIAAAGARGAWLAIAVLLFLYTIYGVFRKKYAPLLIAVIVAIPAIYLVLEERGSGTRLGNTVAIVEKYLESGEIEMQTGEGYSTGVRIQLWDAAINSIKNHPILGVGSGDFKETFPDVEFKTDSLYAFNHAHNDYLQAWSALGLLGLLSIIGLITIPLWSALSFKSPATPYIVIIVIIYAINALTNAPFIRTYSLKYYLFVVGLLLILHQRYSVKSA